jgi:ribosome biogenesis GTPase
MALDTWGWNARLEQSFASYRNRGLAPARITRQDRDRYEIATSASMGAAVVSGRFRHEAPSAAAFPAVGDWVGVAPGDPAIIHAVLPRTSAFSRRAPGERVEEQVVAANVAAAFLVCGLDGDFNPRRLERYVAAVYESGAAPVVVLNKADLCTDVAFRLSEAREAAPGEPVHLVSARTGKGLEELAEYLTRGRTVALLGMSGVGKSSLVNALLGNQRQATHAVRAADSRGRHTTTHRELIPLPSGAILLDTPGMRTLALWADEAGVDASFGEIEALALSCRFRDCVHDHEPGCAVLAGLASGTLREERYESWRKLQREAAAFAARHDARLRLEHKRRWRAIAKANRTRPDKRRRN